ncbi:hypothetical protein C5167_050819 [Papaver somniferum]|uniref:Importin subunit beta-1/Transportin-1-like TPR repeats domain-containing protein n=1 Tax=Papaver somniferum TaxID=3469 RepID=A0A4Y7KR62_PAPSO|nr:hypothetical protein C5167_050819 [Papaver somniferum]
MNFATTIRMLQNLRLNTGSSHLAVEFIPNLFFVLLLAYLSLGSGFMEFDYFSSVSIRFYIRGSSLIRIFMQARLLFAHNWQFPLLRGSKAVHSGADLESAIANCMGYKAGVIGGSIVRREAIFSIRGLVYVTGPEFSKYMPMFNKYLEKGLQNVRDYQVLSVSVEVVGDMCRALDDKILPFCDGIMSRLLTGLSTGVMHPSMTPLIFSCFGDFGIAIGKHFEKYLPYAMPMIQVASKICAEMEQPAEVWYL